MPAIPTRVSTMFDWFHYLAFVAGSALIVIVPGPMVTLIVANSLRSGARAGLANVAGGQSALLVMVLVVGAGLHLMVAQVSVFFDWLRLLGAAYLIWLGIGLLRSNGEITSIRSKPLLESFFVQGFLVMVSNPKALVFLSAFLPQFVNEDNSPFLQVCVLGLVFMVIATLLDGAYALIAGNARRWLSRRNIRWCERFGGSFLVLSGLWLTVSRR